MQQKNHRWAVEAIVRMDVVEHVLQVVLEAVRVVAEELAPIVAKTRVKAIALAAVEEIAQVHPISKGYLLNLLKDEKYQDMAVRNGKKYHIYCHKGLPTCL